MATDSLATPKLRLKPVLLIGTIAALAGVLEHRWRNRRLPDKDPGEAG